MRTHGRHRLLFKLRRALNLSPAQLAGSFSEAPYGSRAALHGNPDIGEAGLIFVIGRSRDISVSAKT